MCTYGARITSLHPHGNNNFHDGGIPRDSHGVCFPRNNQDFSLANVGIHHARNNKWNQDAEKNADAPGDNETVVSWFVGLFVFHACIHAEEAETPDDTNNKVPRHQAHALSESKACRVPERHGDTCYCRIIIGVHLCDTSYTRKKWWVNFTGPMAQASQY